MITDPPQPGPWLYVMPPFHALPFNQKQSLVEGYIRYKYGLADHERIDPPHSMSVHDGRTAKQIGTWLSSHGLHLD